MTIATIGRLMKNFAMAGYLATAAGDFRVRLGIDLAAGAGLLDALDNHPLARPQPLVNHPLRPNRLGGFHRTGFHGVIGLHDGDQLAALDFTDRPLRHQQSARLGLHRRPHPGELAGAQQVFRVGEQRGDLDRAGFDIDLAVGEEELPAFRVDAAVGQNQLQRRLSFGIVAVGLGPGEAQILLFAQGDESLDRVDLGNRRQHRVGAAGADQVAQLRL